MTVQLLEYDAPTPLGATFTRNGYLDFKFPVKGIQEGLTVYHLPPENEYEEYISTGENEARLKRIVKQLPNKYMYDVHRRIPDYLNYKDGKQQYLNRADFKENVLEFADLYGCWFSADVTSKDYKLHNVDEWRSEWRDVQRAVKFIEFNSQLTAEFGYDVIEEKDKIKPEEIERKLNDFTTMTIESPNGAMAIQPRSIGGWVWSLIYKDYYDGITYTTCPNPKCIRELPSHSPITRREMKYCSQVCKSAVLYIRKKTPTATPEPTPEPTEQNVVSNKNRKRKAIKKNAINFQDVSADFQEWLRDEDRRR